MLFNSFEFLVVFLPAVIAVVLVLRALGFVELIVLWLVLASIAFHAYWKLSYTWLFLVTVGVNYIVGRLCNRGADGSRTFTKRTALVFGIAFNLCLLGYFKYAGFFADAIRHVTGVHIDVGTIVLPLAISFYTFQQIGFLVDSYRGAARCYSVREYVSYLAFFPHLIAGPIVRHDSLVNQLSSPQILATRPDAILSGLGIIMIGLFKKVVIADGAAQFVDPVFFASEQGVSIGLAHAWLATALFAFVIYFDFSGYSDIAIGLARLFNVRFPENFASPYKAPNIADFWRRWHITLSQFLQHYLYVPLGGNRRGPARQTANMAITMLLGGLWHGAGWNFVIWGGLHGAYLAIYRAWNLLRPNGARPNTSLLRVVGARSLTFLAVVVAWVFFRATSLESALNILAGMVGLNGWTTTIDLPAGPIGNGFVTGVALALILLIGVNVLPTTQEYMARFRPTIRMYRGTRGWSLPLLRFAPTAGHVSALTALGLIAVSHLDRVQAFIYFRL